MPRYRTKPREVEAIQYTGENEGAFQQFVKSHDGMIRAYSWPCFIVASHTHPDETVYIKSGEYLVFQSGRFCVWNREMFESQYEPIEEPSE